MTYRYVIRPPSILTTPRELSAVLGAMGTRHASRKKFQWSNEGGDFFLSYPDPSLVVDSVGGGSYSQVSAFYRKHKMGQRASIIASGIRTPSSYASNRWVVRPLRHMGGRDFSLIESDEQPVVNTQTHYVSPFFDKKWEYRLVFVKGRHCLTLYKRVDPGTPSNVPWNHACGSVFVTTDDWNACRLRHTTVLEDLGRCPIIAAAHLVAVDVMLRKEPRGDWQYAVCEYNFAPALSIPENLEKVKEYAYSRPE